MNDANYIRIVGLIALPIAILLDSQKRLGRKRWGWAIGMFLLCWGGLSQHARTLGPDVPIDYVLGELTAVWIFGFGVYRLCTRSQRLFQRVDKKTHTLLEDTKVMQFYKNTLSAYSSGKMSALGKGFEELGRLPYEKFVRIFPPKTGTALHFFFTNFPPAEDEFLVATQKGRPGWFVLTNQRLVQKDGKTGQFKEIVLKNVKNHEVKGRWTASLRFEMITGENVVCSKVHHYPLPAAIREVLTWQQENEDVQNKKPVT